MSQKSEDRPLYVDPVQVLTPASHSIPKYHRKITLQELDDDGAVVFGHHFDPGEGIHIAPQEPNNEKLPVPAQQLKPRAKYQQEGGLPL